MTNAEHKIIRKWAKLRHWDWRKVEDAAISLYNSLTDNEKQRMIAEFKMYISDVKSGIIKPTPVELKIPKIKLDNM
jgi:hypothetical protein